MSKPFHSAAVALAVFVSPMMLTAPGAHAAIVCKDGFQKSAGGWISTPYCNDDDLARIARRHGIKVSADEVRKIPGKKYELCRFLGPERTSTYCPDEEGSGRGR